MAKLNIPGRCVKYVYDLYEAWKKKPISTVAMPGSLPPHDAFLLVGKDLISFVSGVATHEIKLSFELINEFKRWVIIEANAKKTNLELMSDEYQAWLIANGLQYEPGDAEELLFLPRLTSYQRDYLTSFCLRWERYSK